MTQAATRPRNGIIHGLVSSKCLTSKRLWGLALIGLLALTLAAGCNTGNRGVSGPPGLAPPPVGFPIVTSISPAEGKPGDILTLSGKNFSPVASENIVTFTDNSQTVNIIGKVESVNVGPFDPTDGALSSMTVRVPSGVRSGFIFLAIRTPTGTLNAQMQQSSFTAAPVIIGVAVNDNGQGTAVLRDVAANLVTDFVWLIGYNLGSSVTDVEIFDGTQVLPADAVVPGLPPNATYSLGAGLEAIGVDLPAGLIPSGGCTTSVLEFTAISSGGTGFPLTSGPFEMPYAVVNPASFTISAIPAHFTGAITPSGIRSGDLDVTFNFVSGPADARWDVVVEYQDPTDPSGNSFIQCTPAPGSMTGATLLTGIPNHRSSTPGIIGPGVTYNFTWDTAADLPGANGTAVSRVRLRPTNPNPLSAGSVSPCVGSLITDWLVIDNSVSTPGTIVEEFSDNEHEDQVSTALWNPSGSGVLTAGPGFPTAPNWGTGTVDVSLDPGSSYLIDTDFGFIVNVTDPSNPIDELSSIQNPGAVIGEMHVRSFVIQDGAIVTIAGSKPLVIRCSGDGSASFSAATIAGELLLSGENAIAGETDTQGFGGAGGPGGGDGGDGALIVVDVNNQAVTAVQNATSGELNGGEAGPSVSWVAFGTSTSLPKGGPGGGGGQGDPGVPLGTSWVNVSRGSGEDGLNTYSPLNNFNAPVGRGGFPHGDSAITNLRGGSGGGGGGGVGIRLTTPTSLAPKHGGGGGGGGGAFSLTARGSVVISGTIHCDGGNGSKGTAGNPGTQSGAGGGGAGGSIVFRATGNIALAEGVELTCVGGFGGVTSSSGPNIHRGGDGAFGRIRIEANGQILAPGIGDFTLVNPPMGTGGPITSGQSATGSIAAEIGTGIDGPLDQSVLGSSGTFRVDTSLGKIFDIADPANPIEVFANMSGDGTFELNRLDIPVAVSLFAVGPNPLIFRVAGPVDVHGLIDVSGQDGEIPDFADVANPTPALGGIAGAGGGAGGGGGDADTTTVGLASAGGMPPTMPSELIDSGPPIGGGGGGGGPTPGNLAIPAQPGGSLIGVGPCASGAGGGGGYGVVGEDGATTTGCPEAGIGGSQFGSTFWLVTDPNDPTNSIPTLFGGGGGAGGGAFSNGIDVAAPGTGGGGAAGFVQISAGGQLKVHSTGIVRAVGGRAFRAPIDGGNGGGGAGGAIRIQGQSIVEIQTGSQFDVRGGLANQDPASAGLNPSYPVNLSFAGGDGGSGRIRIETPLGFSDGSTLTTNPQYSPGLFATAGLTRRRAVSLPYLVSVDGVSILRPSLFPVPTSPFQFAQFASPLPQDAHAIILFEGAFADPTDNGKPGTYFGLVDDPSFLNGVDYIRGQWFLFSSPISSPQVESIVLPFD